MDRATVGGSFTFSAKSKITGRIELCLESQKQL
jgi:hypothetical protein